MPRQVTVTETYWAVCWKWIFPYPCRRRRTVDKWEYNFTWVQEIGYFVRCKLTGCEPPNRYVWWAWCFNIVGSSYFYNVVKYFDQPLRQEGACGGPPIEVLEAGVSGPSGGPE